MKPVCMIVGAGDFYEGSAPLSPRSNDYVIAADAGYATLEHLGVRIDEVIGDFDSMGHVPTHPNLQRLPVEKDDTDMLYALRVGLRHGYTSFRLYGGVGGRLDHTLANLQCLAWLAHQGYRGVLYDKDCVITAIHNDALRLKPLKAGVVSVFAQGGTAQGVSLSGLQYELDNAELKSDFPLGVSNALIGRRAEIRVENGTLIVCCPHGALEED